MMAKNLSLGNLVDLGKLKRNIKKALKTESIFWQKVENMDILCDGHWIVRIYVYEDSKFADELREIFNGRVPDNGQTVCRRGNNVFESDLDLVEHICKNGDGIECKDTKIKYDVSSAKRTVRLFWCGETRQLIGIDDAFNEMVTENYEMLLCHKGQAINPVFYVGHYDEVVMILPVRTILPPWITTDIEERA